MKRPAVITAAAILILTVAATMAVAQRGGVSKFSRLVLANNYPAVKAMLQANPRLVFIRDRGASARPIRLTPLHWAAGFNRIKIAKLLLEYKAPVGARDIAGQTPLTWALKQGHPAMAALLRAHGGRR